jgi:hypothetical protein
MVDNDEYTLLCLVRGDSAENAFAVNINRGKLVSELKKLIKSNKAPEFDDVAADKLELWAVSVPEDDEEGLKALELKHDAKKGVRKLRPAWTISKAFTEKPADEHIHVVVERPFGIVFCFCLYPVWSCARENTDP